MEIASALSSFSALVALAKTAMEARDDAKLKEAVSSMSDKLLGLYAFALEREEKLHALESTIERLRADLKDREAELKEKVRYKLAPLGSNGHAYRLFDEEAVHPVEPPVYFCQHCYDKGVKSILRHMEDGGWGAAQWHCVESNQHTIYE